MYNYSYALNKYVFISLTDCPIVNAIRGFNTWLEFICLPAHSSHLDPQKHDQGMHMSCDSSLLIFLDCSDLHGKRRLNHNRPSSAAVL
jgi:hypothetical protein